MQNRNLLLIEDNPGDARLVKELFRDGAASEFSLHWVERLSAGLERLKQGDIDLVLLDFNLPDSSGLATFTRISEAAAQVPVIVLTGLDDQSLALAAVRQGAQDFLVKGEIDAHVLVRSVRYAIERQHVRLARAQDAAPRAGRVVGFLGAKGGVGTTTLVLNVGAALAARGRSVVGAELRPDPGSFSLYTRHREPRSLADLLALPPDGLGAQAVAGHIYAMPSGLKLLYGPQTDRLEIPEEEAAALIRSLSALADFCLLDLGSTVDSQAAAAVRKCDFTAVVLEPETVGLAAAARALECLRRQGCNPSSLGAVVVRRAALASPISLADIGSQLNCELLGTVPPAPEECAAASRVGMPVVLHQPDSIVAGSLEELAGRLASPAFQAMRAA